MSKVVKTPVIMQLEALECGAACLTMIMAYYDKWIPLEEVRVSCGVSRDGSNALNVIRAARHYGLDAKGYRFDDVESLKSSATFPCIVHWNFNHFVVLNGFKGNKAYLNDPARGSYSVPIATFDDAFTGICLMFSKGENFVPSGKPKSMLEFAKKRLSGSATALIFTALVSTIAMLIAAIRPAFSRVFIDRLLSGTSPNWLVPFLLIFAGFNILQIIASAVVDIYTLRINGKMAATSDATYMWKVLRMPIEFFTQRMAGDIQNRQASNQVIANTLINVFAPLLLNGAMMIFYLVVMIRYSPWLTLIGIGSIAINLLISRIISKKRVNITRVAARDVAKLSSATVAGIEMIETIKSSGAEEGYFARWAGFQASVNTAQVKLLKVNQYLGSIPNFISTLANSFVLIIGVYLTMQGQFTVGMVMAFQGFLTAFMQPASTLITASQTIQEMRTQMERVDDVMEYPTDDTFKPESPEVTESTKLTGDIKIVDVDFGYSPLAEPIIKDFSLEIKPGTSVAIVGSSGSGKSTMSKLISGLYTPWSGEILFDGRPLSDIEKNVFTGSLAVVDQDIILFEDTIANNIKMWDDSIEDFEMILAARDAQLHDDIMERPHGYQHKLIEGGRDFSGGQRQRMEIARVLAQDPTVIILDEATSALDSKTEYDVVRAIRDRGITCIVIAHRLSTIRSCDEIILMDNGKIAARGTHKELMETSEQYRTLVTSE